MIKEAGDRSLRSFGSATTASLQISQSAAMIKIIIQPASFFLTNAMTHCKIFDTRQDEDYLQTNLFEVQLWKRQNTVLRVGKQCVHYKNTHMQTATDVHCRNVCKHTPPVSRQPTVYAIFLPSEKTSSRILKVETRAVVYCTLIQTKQIVSIFTRFSYESAY